jgi:hypothetical protein
MKSGSQNEINNFEMGCKLNAEREKKMDDELLNKDNRKIETIKEELNTTESNNFEDSIFEKNRAKNKV